MYQIIFLKTLKNGEEGSVRGVRGEGERRFGEGKRGEEDGGKEEKEVRGPWGGKERERGEREKGEWRGKGGRGISVYY